MKYILDFDEVLFNTTALKQKMEALGIPESERGLDVFETIAEADPEFSFEDLVFPGALEFIKEHGHNCVIVSSASSVTAENNTNLEAQLKFQTEKIIRSGVTKYVAKEHMHVVGVEKSEALAELQKKFGDQIVFVDDRERYIREAKELGITAVWMDREHRGVGRSPEGVPTMLEFQRVGSFKEFAELMQTCDQKEK